MLAVGLANFSEDSIAYLFKGLLAVVGGYAAGFLLGFLAAKGFDRYIVRTASPNSLHTVVKHTSGIIVAIIVALFYFASGKGPGNGGDGSGDGTKQGDTKATGGTQPTNAVGTPATKPEIPPAKVQIVEAVMVRVFGGEAVEAGTENYFRVDDGPGKTDLAGVRESVRKKLLATKGRVAVVFEYDPLASRRTSGGIILDEAKDTLGAPLLSIAAYRELLAKQP